MSRDITTLTCSSAMEGMLPERAQLVTQNQTIPSSDDCPSINVSNGHNSTEDPSLPSLKGVGNGREDNTHEDRMLGGSDDPGGKRLAKEQDPTMEISDRNVNRSRDSVRCTSPTVSAPVGHYPSPLTVVSTRCAPPRSEDEPQFIPIMVDEPDPRLIDALRKPLDRPIILKIEQEVIAFIVGTLYSYDTSPLNSYHRMLVHKIAEFYRLTHIVSPDAMDCVRLFRGHAARIPPVKLSDIASQKSPSDTSPSGPQLAAVKIMRRKSFSQMGVDGELDQPGDGTGSGGTQASDHSKLMTREEKEVAYQLARARIFGDFKESPPESPSLSKNLNERQRSHKEQDDEFQSRSQYPYRVVTQTFTNFGNLKFTPSPCPVPGFSGTTQSSHILNPAAASFSPNSGAFIPGPQPGSVQPVLSQQHPVTLRHGAGYSMYPPTLPSNMPLPPSQANLSRPVATTNVKFTSTISPLPSVPQSSSGNAAPGNLRSTLTNTAFVPTTTHSSQGHPQFGRFPDQNSGNPPSFPYFVHQNSNINGGWPIVTTNSVQQQGRFQQGDGPLRNGHPGSFGPYGVGRG